MAVTVDRTLDLAVPGVGWLLHGSEKTRHNTPLEREGKGDRKVNSNLGILRWPIYQAVLVGEKKLSHQISLGSLRIHPACFFCFFFVWLISSRPYPRSIYS